MRANVECEDMIPFYYMLDNSPSSSTIKLEVSSKTVNRWKKVTKEFFIMQKEIASIMKKRRQAKITAERAERERIADVVVDALTHKRKEKE